MARSSRRAERKSLPKLGWGGLHWTDLALVIALCAVPLIAAYKIWQNSEALLKTLAVIALAGIFVRGDAREEARRLVEDFRSPLGALALVTIVYVLASSLWAPEVKNPLDSHPFVSALRMLWLVAAAVVVAIRLAEIPSERVHLWIAMAVGLGLILVSIELVAKFPVLRRVARSVSDGQVNPNVMTLSMLAWPAIGTLVVQQRKLAAFVLWAVAGAVVAIGPSGAAVLGFVAGSTMVALAWKSPPLAIRTGTAVAVGGLVFAPLLGKLAGAAMELLPSRLLAGAHPFQRIEIWQQHAAAIMRAPVAGVGFRGLGNEHPHSAALQVWVEFGAVGAVLAAALIVLVGAALLRSPSPRTPFALACFMAIYANAYVSLGMWEAQWVAIVLLVAVFAVHALHDGRRPIGLAAHGTGYK